jgi:DNA-binding response OmpR family regulator
MNGKRILVVEDEALIAMFLADILTVMGHTVCANVATEQEAVTAAKRERPDLMIVDANLQEGSGVGAVGQILRSGFIPHIFVTGDRYGLAATDLTAIVVVKPFTLNALASAMERALKSAPPAHKG